MMRWLKALPVFFLYLCAATTVAEAIGIGILWQDGLLTSEKMTKYSAVMYGFDLRDLESPEPDPSQGGDSATGVEGDARIQEHPLVRDRFAAVTSETRNIHAETDYLQSDHNRLESVKSSFGDRLDQLEEEARVTSLQEVQRTLEILQPKQAKDLLLRILDDPSTTVEDPLDDVISIVRAMPQEKLRKIFGEFKTEDERQTLHQILLVMGEMAENKTAEPSS